jgi:FMN reductase (NADPH)
MTTVAIVPAAGRGMRLGADKALLDLGGTTAIERVVGQCLAAGVDRVSIVRRGDAAPLPSLPPATSVVPVAGDGEMVDSLRAAVGRLGAEVDRGLVFPVDHALVMADTIAALLATVQRPDCRVALPLFRERPGHPIALTRALLDELLAAGVASLRDVVHAHREHTRAVPTASPWVLTDLDRPEDLRAAQAALSAQPWPPVELMFRHRSRREYAATPLASGQLERLVDAARSASTSSYIQAYAVVAVREKTRKDKVAELCGNQEHIRQAPVFLAICADLSKLELACQQVGDQLRHESFELFLQATVDAALLGQNLQLAAESEGLGACMIGGARNHPLQLAELLRLPPHAFVLFGMTIGHATDDPIPRGRMQLSAVLHAERYDRDILPAALQQADEQMRAWAHRTNRDLGGYLGRPVSETKGWTHRMAAAWGQDSQYARARATLRDELDRLGFGLH